MEGVWPNFQWSVFKRKVSSSLTPPYQELHCGELHFNILITVFLRVLFNDLLLKLLLFGEMRWRLPQKPCMPPFLICESTVKGIIAGGAP